MFFDVHTHSKRNATHSILNLEEFQLPNHPFSIGIHPKYSELKNADLELFKSLIDSPFCLAIGEIGLDKIIDVSFEKQIALFELQIAWSEKFKLPVILHCVKAWNEVQAIRKKYKVSQAWVFHGFRKTSLLPSVLAEENLFIGIGTAIIWDERLQETLIEIPLDRILLETDADESYTIEDVYEKVSQLKNISLLALKKQLETNFKKTFHKWEIGSIEWNSLLEKKK